MMLWPFGSHFSAEFAYVYHMQTQLLCISWMRGCIIFLLPIQLSTFLPLVSPLSTYVSSKLGPSHLLVSLFFCMPSVSLTCIMQDPE